MDKTKRRLLTVVYVGLYVWCQKVAATKSTETPEVQEYCEWESFNATCGPDEVIMIHGARYGRMNLGRCITKDYGNIGCGTDVTSDFDLKCSGKRTCIIPVISLHNKRSCPKDFKSYLEAGYKCIKVHTPETTICPESGHVKITSPSGYIASAVALESGIGNGSCPLVIEVKPHQRINISLVDLSMAVGSNHWFYGSQDKAENCEAYATIQEPDSTEGRTICGGRTRESVIYSTRGNQLEVKLSLLAARKSRFLLKYEAYGCPPLAMSDHAWSESFGDHIVVRCNLTEAAWYLTCQGSHWVGDIGNCSGSLGSGSGKWGLTALSGVSDFPLGILIVVTLGVAIGVAVGVMMLVAVLAYMKRRRRRKIRSRSNFALKQVTQSQPPTPKPYGGETGTWNSDIRTPMLYPKQPETDASSPGKQSRTYLDTWQRSRPLPVPRQVPRPTSDSGIEQETDGLTMTPESPSPSIFTTFRPEFERTMLMNGHVHTHRPTDFGEHVAPYYFKVDRSWPTSPGEDYGTAKKPDVLSTCNLCQNNGTRRPTTNV